MSVQCKHLPANRRGTLVVSLDVPYHWNSPSHQSVTMQSCLIFKQGQVHFLFNPLKDWLVLLPFWKHTGSSVGFLSAWGGQDWSHCRQCTETRQSKTKQNLCSFSLHYDVLKRTTAFFFCVCFTLGISEVPRERTLLCSLPAHLGVFV